MHFTTSLLMRKPSLLLRKALKYLFNRNFEMSKQLLHPFMKSMEQWRIAFEKKCKGFEDVAKYSAIQRDIAQLIFVRINGSV